MENLVCSLEITLKAEFHLSPKSFVDTSELIKIKGNRDGVFVSGMKISDIFFNGIQLRLYFPNGSYYIIFDKGCENSGFSLEGLHEKLEELFILSIMW